MSEKNDDFLDIRLKITSGLLQLIEALDELGLIDVKFLWDNLRTSVVKIKFDQRVNCSEVAKWLSTGYPVFIPVDRKRAYYIGKRLEDLLKVKIEKKPAIWDNEKGYLFFMK